MSKSSSKAGSHLAALIVLVPFLIGGYFASSLFLPVWRWENVDFEALARSTGIPQSKLQQTYQVSFRYGERGPGDPVPWQLLSMEPTWEGEPPEFETVVRAHLLSDRDGAPISSLKLGSGSYKDRYFTAKAWRFPPGTFGMKGKRPVLVFDASTLEKCSIPAASSWEERVGQVNAPKWPTTDDDIDDYTPPAAPEAGETP